MKFKNKIHSINLNFFIILFIFGITSKVFSSEKNYVIATIDRSPITYFDLKQKARLIYFIRTRNSEYKNLNKYFELSLESLISQNLLMKKAEKFNKNILKLTQRDAFKYLLQRYNNSNEVFEKFLKKNNLSKSVVISNVQLEIIKKYLIGKMFEKEYDDYLNEIRKIANDKSNEIDLEQIIVKTNTKNVEIINTIDNEISSLSNQGYSFKEIAKILSKNKLIKVSAGRSGWQNKKNIKSNTFEKLFQFPEGKIVKEKFNDNLNYLRIIGKRKNGKFSSREQIIDLIRLSYLNSKKNKLILDEFKNENLKLNCNDIYTKLNELKVFNLKFQKVNLTNFSEKLLLIINKTKVRYFTEPITFNNENIQFYICKKINVNKNEPSRNIYDENLLKKKVETLTDKILKILKKDAIIDIKVKVNELN